MADDVELPRHELLIKIMGMTTAENDNQALVAMRKANAILSEAGWSWEKVLRAQIKIIESPFAKGDNPFADRPAPSPVNAPQPRRRTGMGASSSSGYKPPPQRPPMPSAQPGCHVVYDPLGDCWVQQPNAPQTPPRPYINSTKKNIYGGWCFCCGNRVDNDAGWVFTPSQFNPRAVTSAKSGFALVCDTCNSSSALVYVPNRAAPQNTGQTTSTPLGNL